MCWLKRVLISAILILTVSVNVNSQVVFSEPEHYIGVKGGAVASSVMFSPTVAQSMRFSFTTGAIYRMISEKYFGLQLELNYIQRGWKEVDTENPYNRMTGYLEIPFMTHITFGSEVCKGFVNLGPSISFLLHESPLSEVTDAPQRSLKSRPVDYGIVGGLGFEVHTVAGVWMIDARYSFGLGDIFPSSAKDYFRSSSNQNIILSLAWLMPLNNRDK